MKNPLSAIAFLFAATCAAASPTKEKILSAVQQLGTQLVSGASPGSEEKPAQVETLANLGVEEKRIRTDARDMLYAENFEVLDKLAVEYTEKRERTPGGVWKLRHFSNGLSEPQNPKDSADWDTLLAKLEKWHAATKTVFSLNAIGHAQLERAWSIRGNGYAYKVAGSAWEGFKEWTDKAEKTLTEAVRRDPACVDVYKNLLVVGLSQGWPMEKMIKMFDQAFKVAPEYYDIYYKVAIYKMERWHGDKGDWQKFLNSIPERVPGDEGLAIYARTAMQLFAFEPEEFFGKGDEKVHWDQMKAGFEAMLRKYPSIFNKNRFAFYASLANDAPTAKKLFLELSEKKEFFAESWGGQENIEKARKWLGLSE